MKKLVYYNTLKKTGSIENVSPFCYYHKNNREMEVQRVIEKTYDGIGSILDLGQPCKVKPHCREIVTQLIDSQIGLSELITDKIKTTDVMMKFEHQRVDEEGLLYVESPEDIDDVKFFPNSFVGLNNYREFQGKIHRLYTLTYHHDIGEGFIVGRSFFAFNEIDIKPKCSDAVYSIVRSLEAIDRLVIELE